MNGHLTDLVYIHTQNEKFFDGVDKRFHEHGCQDVWILVTHSQDKGGVRTVVNDTRQKI